MNPQQGGAPKKGKKSVKAMQGRKRTEVSFEDEFEFDTELVGVPVQASQESEDEKVKGKRTRRG